MEIKTDSIISEQQIREAIQFGTESLNLPQMDAKEYAITLMKRLLLHNEKVKKNLLEPHLNPVIATLWQEVLSSLEDNNRKLVNVKSGSLIFTLFCPTGNSLQQFKDEKWRIDLKEKVEKLLKALGMLRINVFFLINVNGSCLLAKYLSNSLRKYWMK